MSGGRSPWLLASVALLAVALVLTIIGRTALFRGSVGHLLSAIARPFTGAGIEIAKEGEVVFASRTDLLQELETREQQVISLAQELANREEAARQRDQALALLGYTERSQKAVIPARVTIRTQVYNHTYLAIDVGTEDGVAEQDAVVSMDGLLVGTIAEVFPHVAHVALLTDPDTSIGASLLDTSGTLGIVRGAEGHLVEFGYVPQSTDVSLNDVVMTSGIDPQIPRGLLIGLINRIEPDTSGPFLQLFLEPLVDVDHVRVVGVIHL